MHFMLTDASRGISNVAKHSATPYAHRREKVKIQITIHVVAFQLVADIEVFCTKYEGVDAVKRALRKGLELSTEAMPVKVCLLQ